MMTLSRIPLGAAPLSLARTDGDRPSHAASTAAGDSLLVATLLRHASIDDGEPTRARAMELARKTLGTASLQRGCAYDQWPAESAIDVIRLLAQRAEHGGMLSTAQSLLESAYRMSATALEVGRVLNDRARNSRKSGRLDLCQGQNAAVLRHANAIDSDELRARARMDLAALAQTRGNLVAMKRLTLAGIRAAEQAQMTRLAATGYIGLGIHAARHRDFDAAVTWLWKGFHRSAGSDESAQEVLVNLGQVLLDAGHPAEAVVAAKLSLLRTNAMHLKLPALGCMAIASAHLGDRIGVRQACTEVRRLARSGHQPRDVASALIDCSLALDLLGADAPSGDMYDRAIAIANTHGFHDLTFIARPRAAARNLEHGFARPAARIVQSLADLEPAGRGALVGQ